jgi:hypothetical protein
MRFSLRTLVLVLAAVPLLLWVGWTKYEARQKELQQQRTRREWLDQFGVLPSPQVMREQRAN